MQLGAHQCCLPVVVYGADIRPIINQCADYVDMTSGSGKLQRSRAAVIFLRIDIRSCREQEVQDLDIAAHSRIHQRG